MAVFLGYNQYWSGGFMVLWFYVPEQPKAHRHWFWLKSVSEEGSHPTDWEKPGIEPATPGLQDIGLSPTPRRLLKGGCRILKCIHDIVLNS